MDRSEALSAQSKMFYKTAKQVRGTISIISGGNAYLLDDNLSKILAVPLCEAFTVHGSMRIADIPTPAFCRNMFTLPSHNYLLDSPLRLSLRSIRTLTILGVSPSVWCVILFYLQLCSSGIVESISLLVMDAFLLQL